MTALLNKREVAELLGRSVSSIDKSVSAREIPFIKINRHVRFDPAALESWLRAHSVPPIPSNRE